MSPSPVNVVGLPNDGMGGLKESLSAFRKHHQQVGDALLNISGIGTATGGPVDKDEPRPKFEGTPYPRMLYHADGREAIAGTPAEAKALEKASFRADPYPKPQVPVGDPRQEKKELLDRNRELAGQVSVLTETLQKMAERLEALEGKGK